MVAGVDCLGATSRQSEWKFGVQRRLGLQGFEWVAVHQVRWPVDEWALGVKQTVSTSTPSEALEANHEPFRAFWILLASQLVQFEVDKLNAFPELA